MCFFSISNGNELINEWRFFIRDKHRIPSGCVRSIMSVQRERKGNKLIITPVAQSLLRCLFVLSGTYFHSVQLLLLQPIYKHYSRSNILNHLRHRCYLPQALSGGLAVTATALKNSTSANESLHRVSGDRKHFPYTSPSCLCSLCNTVRGEKGVPSRPIRPLWCNRHSGRPAD